MSQEIIEDFAVEMMMEGHTIMMCPECKGALWLEGDLIPETGLYENIRLMRYSTALECEACVELHNETCDLNTRGWEIQDRDLQ